MSFKKGDSVMCVDASLADLLVEGNKYRVHQAWTGSEGHPFVRVDQHPGETFLADRFEASPMQVAQESSPTISGHRTYSGLPLVAKARKAIPLYSGCIQYFPDALAAVAELSRVGNEQHNPGKPLHWDRSKSGDELDALTRHLVQAGTIDTDGVRHSTKVAWRALANLQKEIERGPWPAKGEQR